MSNGLNNPSFDINNPLSSEQLTELKDSLIEIANTRAGLEKARQAGIDVTKALSDLDKAEQSARAFLSVYDTD